MKYSKYLGLLLVAMIVAMGLSACGSSQSAAAKVDCKVNVSGQLDTANAALAQAQSKLKESAGTPGEKDAQQSIDQAQATINALKACPPPTDGAKSKVTVELAKQGLQQMGFKSSNIVTDNLKPNTADPGHGVFSQKMIQTPADAVAFLSSGTPEAKDAIRTAIQQTSVSGAETTEAQLRDPTNWAALQLNVPTVWKGNTYYMGGMQSESTGKVDAAGTVVLVFVPPGQVAQGKVTSLFALRGACGNPQTVLPQPAPPTAVCPPGTSKAGQPVPPGGVGECSPPKKQCTPPSIMLPQGVCSQGKNANQAPKPSGGPVIQCPGGYLDRYTGKCVSGTYTPPSNNGGGSGGTSSGSSTQGQGDSGPGATNTTAPPPTTQPAPAPPQTSSPPTPVATPTF